MPGDPSNPAPRDPLTSERAAGLLDLGFHTLLPDEPAPDSGEECQDHPGDLISRYRLIEPLGEGGFGYVWSAEQSQPVHRIIALKLIKRGMNSREIIARFAAESQALALMDHPNIAAVLDAGATADGRPFFAMELVKGEPLVSYCTSRNMGLRERIELFIPVCHAVQHAHQKAILHRDLKPSNILVAEIDGKPVPKVIDFGIAKALGATPEAALDASLLLTRAGAIMGTLQYMSPEQAGSVPDVDTRSDIYSLGVILYELLTGITPLCAGAPPNEPYDETLRRIRTQEAARPSTVIRRSGEPAKLRRSLCGDLDWITIKALEKDRRRRYETATALAADLRRHLDREPVSAAAPSWTYQFSKFARRNRTVFVSAALVAAALIAGITTSLSQAARAKQAGEKAEQNRREAEANRGMAERNLSRAREAVDKFLNSITDDPRLKEADFMELRSSLLESALPFYEELSGDDPGGRSVTIEQGKALNSLGLIYQELNRGQQAVAAYHHAIEVNAALAAAEPHNPLHRRSLLTAYNNLAMALDLFEDKQPAVEAQARAVELARALVADYPENGDYRQHLVSLLINSGHLLAAQGRYAEAMTAIRESLAASEALVADFPQSADYAAQLGYVHASLGTVMHRAQEPGAEDEFRKAREVQEKRVKEPGSDRYDRRLLATTCLNLGHILAFSGRWEEGLGVLREAAALHERLIAEMPSIPAYRESLGRDRSLIGMCLLNLGRSWEAEPELQEAIAIHHRLADEFPADHAHWNRGGVALDLLANLKRKARDWKAARALYESSIESHRRVLSAGTEDSEGRGFIAERRASMAEMALEQGDPAQAVRDALTIPETQPARWEEAALAARITAQAVTRAMEGDDLPESERRVIAEPFAAAAVQLLQLAIDRRYPFVPELGTDPAFEPLRSYPAFQALREPPADPAGISPDRFSFDYPYDDPGPRHWVREGERWTESQPSGARNEYTVVGRTRVRGISGTEISNTKEPAFHLFVPDQNTPVPAALYMRRDQTPWAKLTDIRDLK